jgi:hypothetical protein
VTEAALMKEIMPRHPNSIMSAVCGNNGARDETRMDVSWRKDRELPSFQYHYKTPLASS